MTTPEPRADSLTEEQVQVVYDSESANIPKISERISTLCKFAWAGSLAIFFGLATAKSDSGTYVFFSGQRALLFASAIAGSVAFLFDYLQNLFAYIHTQRFLTWIEVNKSFSKTALNQRVAGGWSAAATFAFYAKNIAAFLAAVLLGLAILRAFPG